MRVLLEHGADVNALADNGVTPLIFAVYQGANPWIVKTLLEAGAKVDARTDDGTTALLFAAHRCDFNAVKLLLDHGANPRAMNDAGHFPIVLATLSKSEDEEAKMGILKMLLEATQKLDS